MIFWATDHGLLANALLGWTFWPMNIWMFFVCLLLMWLPSMAELLLTWTDLNNSEALKNSSSPAITRSFRFSPRWPNGAEMTTEKGCYKGIVCIFSMLNFSSHICM